MNNKFTCSLLFVGLVVGSFALGYAQDVPTVTTSQPLPKYRPGVTVVQGGGALRGFQFVSGEPAISAQVTRAVTEAPYSLDATIESAQLLSDGNRIVHRQTVHLYRDS